MLAITVTAYNFPGIKDYSIQFEQVKSPETTLTLLNVFRINFQKITLTPTHLILSSYECNRGAPKGKTLGKEGNIAQKHQAHDQGFPCIRTRQRSREGVVSGKEKAHKHEQIFPVTARVGGGLPTGWPGVSRPVARGQKFMCCVWNQRNINIFVRVPGREDRVPGREDR